MHSIIPFFQLHPYPALFGMIFIEEVGVYLPFPGDAVLLLFGVWSREGRINFLPTLLVVCLATMIGSVILYYFSRWLGQWFLQRYSHLLRYLHITQSNIDLIEGWMSKYGWATLVVARVTPGLRIVGTVAAGVLNVPLRVFFPATLLGTVLWTAVYFSIGSLLGRRYADQIDQLLSNRFVFFELVVVAVIIWVILAKFGIPLIRKRIGNK